MKLAPRLLLVASVTLLLPWAGCEYIREVESALRDRQAETLGATADMLAAVLGSRLDAGSPDPGGKPAAAADLYAHPLERAPRLDGYADDWGLPPAALRMLPDPDGDDFSVRYQLATDGISLFLFLQVDDDQVITGDSGDQVRLRMGSAIDGFTELEFMPEAPGPIQPRASRDGIGRRVRGNWQATSGGYNLEAQIPLQLAGHRLGLLVSDADGRGPVQRTGTMENLAREPGRLITPLRSAESILEGAVRSGQRLRLVDRDGYVLAEAHGGAAPSGEQLPPPARRLFRWICSIRREKRPRPPTRSPTRWTSAPAIFTTTFEQRPNSCPPW